MGCHILDPVFAVAGPDRPGLGPLRRRRRDADSWGLDSQVRYVFPGTSVTAETLTLHWYDGDRRPPDEIQARIGGRPLNDQGSIYLGDEGRPVFAVHRPAGAAAGREVRRLQASRAGRRRPLSPVRRRLPRQRQDLGAVRLRRPADRIGPARLPGHAVPEDDARMERRTSCASPTSRTPTASSAAGIARAGKWRVCKAR